MRSGFAFFRQRVAEDAVAEGAGGGDGCGSGGDQLRGADVADALAGLLAEKDQAAARAAAETAGMRARGFDELAGESDDLARLLVDVAIAAQVAGVVVDDFFRFAGRGLRG